MKLKQNGRTINSYFIFIILLVMVIVGLNLLSNREEDKPERRVIDVHVDYTGFNIPDEFVVGYGLDYDQRYRNLPYIGVVEFD